VGKDFQKRENGSEEYSLGLGNGRLLFSRKIAFEFPIHVFPNEFIIYVLGAYLWTFRGRFRMLLGEQIPMTKSLFRDLTIIIFKL